MKLSIKKMALIFAASALVLLVSIPAAPQTDAVTQPKPKSGTIKKVKTKTVSKMKRARGAIVKASGAKMRSLQSGVAVVGNVGSRGSARYSVSVRKAQTIVIRVTPLSGGQFNISIDGERVRGKSGSIIRRTKYVARGSHSIVVNADARSSFSIRAVF